jgi:two-component system response regulator AlgR
MRVLIVDDEPLARARIADLLDDIDDVEVVGQAPDGRAALECVERACPDLVLLDIRMPGIDGLETARHLALLEAPPAIVFCTAYEDHALAAFERNAVDYLLKPIRRDRLEIALAKVSRMQMPGMAGHRSVPVAQRRSHLCARVRGNLVLVAVDDIRYLLAGDRYVAARHPGGELLVEEPLKSLEEEFADRFVRIHRNCLVARERLAGLTRGADGRVFVQVEGLAEPLEASRRNLPALRKLMRRL